MDNVELRRIEANIFPVARAAIGDPMKFDWHRSRGSIDTWQSNSSQALCIDLFGTLNQVPEKESVLGQIAGRLGLRGDGPWEIRLEWTEHGNPLNERRRSQVDAAAIGRKSIILFECKFTEKFGGCSQPMPRGDGAHKGKFQCNGNYEPQTNPITNINASCALTGKGIHYWDYIPELFALDSFQVYQPCPFRGQWYQLMRNLTLAAALQEKSNKTTAVAVIYANHPNSAMTQWLQSPEWTEFKRCLRTDMLPFVNWPYASFIRMIQEIDTQNDIWDELAYWISDKKTKVFECT